MFERVKQVRKVIVARSPEGLLVGGFAALIAIGTILLALPWSHQDGVGLLDAFFTATSAVCVTGLIVVDTSTAYTTFGQLVIMLLIEAGGIGVMSFAALAVRLMGRRLSLRARAALSNSILQRDVASEFGVIFKRILIFVAVAEISGALLLFVAMFPSRGLSEAAYSAVFHSVSAFCNAGFSIYGDNLTGLRDNPLVMVTIMMLIVLGGIGHPVVVDVWQRLSASEDEPQRRQLALNSKVALSMSGALIVVGVVLLVAFGLTPAEQTWTERLGGALFSSVSARTAGFNTIDIGRLAPAPLFLLVVLMFIGGSPASCAGGIKTTTFALWLASLWGRLRGRKSPRIFGRHIPGTITRHVSVVIGLAVAWNVVGVLLLLASETSRAGVGMHDVVFEEISAFGTVGLSTGLTPTLSTFGRLWIIATMFVGRLGPLTVAMWMFTTKTPRVRYPEGRIMIG